MEDAHQKAAEMDDEELKKGIAKHGRYAVLLDDALVMLGKPHANRDWSNVGARLRTALGYPHLGRWFCLMFHTFLAHDLSCLSTAQEHIAHGKASIMEIQSTFKATGHNEEFIEWTIGTARDMLQKIEIKVKDLIDITAEGEKLIASLKQDIVDMPEMLENQGKSEVEIEAFQATLKEDVVKLEDSLSQLLASHQAVAQTEGLTEPNDGTA
ncbi:hypothetical protein LTR56_001943 [Elasticomyces elasticus]|nr:hypothetical protein LTR22_011529 [Elasticomyces elasticus]KAK3658087.1 hypothetical protein LTR56_001943 [Elasticomyces elasticus]KAK4914926.1 hypothetical protein LTR49_016915 [Elasticomyces elasticus]KAK5740623.1 hypothetical protein LTS12_024882 [Elasticomyces elasticus]